MQAIQKSEEVSNGEENKTLRSTLGQTETLLMYVMGGFIIGSISTVVALIFLNQQGAMLKKKRAAADAVGDDRYASGSPGSSEELLENTATAISKKFTANERAAFS